MTLQAKGGRADSPEPPLKLAEQRARTALRFLGTLTPYRAPAPPVSCPPKLLTQIAANWVPGLLSLLVIFMKGYL